MATPSSKPTWLDRYTMIGDTIPMSRPAGGGGGANRTYVDFGDTPSYPTGTQFHAFQEPATSGAQNRPHWALAEGLAWLYERQMSQPYTHSGSAASPTAHINLSSAIIYLGEQGAVAGNLNLVSDILDGNWNEVDDGASPPGKVVATDLEVQSPTGSTFISCYPGGGLPADTANAPVSGVGSPDNYSISMSSPLVGSAVSVSVMNYDKWLRAVRDNGDLSSAFATIVQWTNNQTFKVHRDVTSAGVTWGTDDTLFLSHYSYAPRMELTPTMPTGTFNLVLGIHNTIGRLDKNALTAIKVRSAEAVPFDTEAYILAGLDGAYDQLGFGSAGGGRTVIVDSKAIQAQIAAYGQIGYQSLVDYSDTFQGTIGAMHIPASNDMYMQNRTGEVVATAINPNDSSGTDCPNRAACSGNATGRITLTSDNFATSGNHNLFEGLDLVEILTTGDAPYTAAGSPDGIYILKSVVTDTTADVLALHGMVPDLTVGGGALKCTLLRPTFVAHSGNIGFHGGILGNKHWTNIATDYGQNIYGSAFEFNTYWKYSSSAAGNFTEKYVGNVSRECPIESSTFWSLTNPWTPVSTGATAQYGPIRNLGIVGTSVNDKDVFVEYLDKESTTSDASLAWKWTQPTGVSGPTGFDTRPEWRLDSYLWDLGVTAEDRSHVISLLPFGLGAGIRTSRGATGDTKLGRATIQFGDWHAGLLGEDSGSIVMSYHDRINYKIQLGMGWGSDGVAPTTSTAFLKEEPVAATGTGPTGVDYSPQTPPTLSATGPGGVTGSNIKHRFEVHRDTNIGHSDWRYMTKKIPLASGHRANSTSTPIEWFLRTLGATPSSLSWWTNDDDTSYKVYFPIQVPHGCELMYVTCRYYSSASLSVTAANLLAIRIDNSAATGGGSGAVVDRLDSGGDISMNPSVVATYRYPSSGEFDQNNLVDLETYSYYTVVEAGDSGAAAVQEILEVTATFRYVDYFPE